MNKSIMQIEFFDTLVAVVAGIMIIPAVYTFAGIEGMSAGPGLIFISLPKIFKAMGGIGILIGIIFFLTVFFAALTSSISIMEAIVASLMDEFGWSRSRSSIVSIIYGIVMGLIVCLGYNKLYFEMPLPGGGTGQILDVMDFLSNNVLMPILALLTCILIGWVVGPKYITDEIESSSPKFRRKGLYVVMIRFVAPALLIVLLLQILGL